ncbi:hypothetical protein RDABS01_010662 [Bienertia sinuspersici]
MRTMPEYSASTLACTPPRKENLMEKYL